MTLHIEYYVIIKRHKTAKTTFCCLATMCNYEMAFIISALFLMVTSTSINSSNSMLHKYKTTWQLSDRMPDSHQKEPGFEYPLLKFAAVSGPGNFCSLHDALVH